MEISPASRPKVLSDQCRYVGRRRFSGELSGTHGWFDHRRRAVCLRCRRLRKTSIATDW
jgi:hypothetical protein